MSRTITLGLEWIFKACCRSPLNKQPLLPFYATVQGEIDRDDLAQIVLRGWREFFAEHWIDGGSAPCCKGRAPILVRIEKDGRPVYAQELLLKDGFFPLRHFWQITMQTGEKRQLAFRTPLIGSEALLPVVGLNAILKALGDKVAFHALETCALDATPDAKKGVIAL